MELLALAGRVVLSLAVVLLLLWLAARGLRRGQKRTLEGIEVDVLARQPLAQRSSIAVVQVGQRALVLGVTESRVELLTEHPLADLLTTPPAALPALATDLTDGVLTDLTDGAPVPRTLSAVAPKASGSPLAGSALSPATWVKALDAVREMTVRR